MNNWSAIFSKPASLISLEHGSNIVQLGSCFSTSVAQRLRLAGFEVLDNPNGVIFHPFALGKLLSAVLSNEVSLNMVQKEDVFLDFNSSSSIYALSEKALKEQVAEAHDALKTALKTAKFLTLTFGSAHGYRLKSTGEMVANCHQQPANIFQKECTNSNELIAFWIPLIQALKRQYPDITIVSTVSPVRYLRDGWIENNRSKAQLIQLCEALEIEGVIYFPSYELVLDGLRDYRYFEKDGVHPNELAIDAVWDLFQEWFFKAKTTSIITELMQLRAMENHRLLYPDSQKAKAFLKQFQQKRESFLSLHTSVVW